MASLPRRGRGTRAEQGPHGTRLLLEGVIQKGRISRSRLEDRVKKALAWAQLTKFVLTTIDGADKAPLAAVDLARSTMKTGVPESVTCHSATLHHTTYHLLPTTYG